jgi:transposase
MVAADAPPQPARRRGSQLDPLMAAIAEALREQPRVSAPRLTEMLRSGHGYGGSVDLVRRRVAQLRAAKPELAPPAGARAGALLEWDWLEMETRVWLGGVRRSVWALVASLPYAGAQTAYFSFDATLESFLEGHVRVLTWLGGVPRECNYDRLRPAVAKRDGRGATRWNKRFRELRAHYDFRTSVWRPASERRRAEEGMTHPGVGGSRREAVAQLRNDFWPPRRFKDMTEVEALYETWRDRQAQNRSAAADETTVAERLEEERKALRALPHEPFDFSLGRSVRVPPDGYVRYGACFYRVPPTLAEGHVELHASRDEVWLVAEGERVASYARSYKPGRRVPARPV